MSKFIISFRVTIDGQKIETGTIGVSSPTTDYYPNRVKNTVTQQYRIKYPSAKNFAVNIMTHQQVTDEQYVAGAKYFIEIKLPR
jgi:hypothetical protein